MSRSLTLLGVVVAVTGLGVAGCSAPPSNSSASQRLAGSQGTATPHLDQVADAIRAMSAKTGSDSYEGSGWSITHGNLLGGPNQDPKSWLVQTQDCWGLSVCDASATQNRMLESIRNIVASGTTVVDILGMTALPTGRFRAALTEGAAAGAAAGHRPLIRILYGEIPATDIGDKKLKGLQADIQKAAPAATVVAAEENSGPFSTTYNHSKVVAADGKVAFVSGINMWDGSYLQSKNPVTDLGVVIQGQAGASAQKFADVLWRDACANIGTRWKRIVSIVPESPAGGCPSTRAPQGATSPGNVAVMALGQFAYLRDGKKFGRNEGTGVSEADSDDARCNVPWLTSNDRNRSAAYDGMNPGLTGMRALVESAKKSVFVAQQDMMVSCLRPGYDVRLFEALASKIAKGIPVTIIQSEYKARIGGLVESYSTYVPLQKTWDTLARYVRRMTPNEGAAQSAMCKSLRLAPLRVSSATTWSTVNPAIGKYALHSKLISVDDEAFYIGSANAYLSQQQEFGYIIENSQASNELRSDFIDPMLKYSTPAAITCPATRR